MTIFNSLEKSNSEERQVNKYPKLLIDMMEFWSHQRNVQDYKDDRSQSRASVLVQRRPAANHLAGVFERELALCCSGY